VRFRKPKPPPRRLSDEEFERLINAHIVRGWTVESRTDDTASLVMRRKDTATIAAFGSDAIKRGIPMKEDRKVVTRWSTEQLWLTPKERRMLGEA
jgi:hypothetical protein